MPLSKVPSPRIITAVWRGAPNILSILGDCMRQVLLQWYLWKNWIFQRRRENRNNLLCDSVALIT